MDLQDINFVSTTLRLLLALGCGGLLGLERGKKKRPAGFRTHMLVCVGSALAMMTNQYMCERFPGIDVSRMGAQVISGIGFLGAGTIMVTGPQRIKGLTTAAGLWVVACIGLAFGTGYYTGGIIATAMCIFINTLLHNVESKVNSANRIISLFLELEDISYIGGLLKIAKDNDITIIELESGKARKDNNHVGIIMTLKLSKRIEHAHIIELFSTYDGMCYLEEMN